MPATQKQIRDVCRVTPSMVFLIGIAAGLSVSLFTYLTRSLGLAPINLELLVGSTFTAQMDSQTWWLGFAILLFASGLSSFAYAFIFWSAHRSGAAVGMNLGLIHWLVSSFFAGILPAFHPLLANGKLEGPGFFMIGSGFAISFTFFLAHMLFGAAVGKFFDIAATRKEYPRPLSSKSDHAFGF